MADRPTRPEGFDKLPARFKTYVTTLEHIIRTLEGQVPSRRMMQGVTVKLVDPLHGGNDGFLPDTTTVEFRIKGNVFRVQHARESRGGDGVEISTEMGRCIVYPEVSNVIVVRSDR